MCLVCRLLVCAGGSRGAHAMVLAILTRVRTAMLLYRVGTTQTQWKMRTEGRVRAHLL